MIVFFGDSITRDWPIHAVVAGDAVNAGIAGQTTGQLLQRFERDVIARRPILVHLLGGINDIAENQGPVEVDEVAANLRAMVDVALAHRIGVVLGLLLPCTTIAKRPHLQPRPAVRRLNALLKTLDGRAGLTIADYFAPLVEDGDRLRPDCTGDGLHPNAAGYAVLQPVARDALARAGRAAAR